MPTSEYQAEFITWRADEGVGRLTLQRPPLNVLDITTIRQMQAALEVAREDGSLRVLLLRGEGKMFSAGVDVADHTADKVGDMIPLFDQVCRSLADFPAPTLAVVHGHALGGGCELALCCDLVLAAEGARLGQPEIKLAVFAPIAALRLPLAVGYHHAAELLFSGEAITASEAARIGLVNRALPGDELEGAVEQLASQLAVLSAPALRMCKRALRQGVDNWGQLAEVERLYLEELMATEDAHEGLASFMEKRAPAWRHR